MSPAHFVSIMAHLMAMAFHIFSAVTWLIVTKRVGIIVAVPLLAAIAVNTHSFRPIRRRILGAAAGLWLSASAIVVSIFVHGADSYWLTDAQKKGIHVSFPKVPLPPGSSIPGIGSLTDALKPFVNAINGGSGAVTDGLNQALSLVTKAEALMNSAKVMETYSMWAFLGLGVMVLLAITYLPAWIARRRQAGVRRREHEDLKVEVARLALHTGMQPATQTLADTMTRLRNAGS